MRSFIFTLLLFAVMLAGIAWNAAAVDRLCDDMLTALDRLPAAIQPARSDAINAIGIRWDHANRWLSLSVSSIEMDRVRDALTALAAHSTGENDADYVLAREQLRQAIEEMRRFELLTWDNVI